MKLIDFNKKYKYKRDIDKFYISEVWEVLELENGFYYGDCESYCRTLKEKIDGFKDWDYYYCKLEGEGHCLLVKGNEVIDCNTKAILPLDIYKQMYSITNFKKYNKIMVFVKILYSYIFRYFKR